MDNVNEKKMQKDYSQASKPVFILSSPWSNYAIVVVMLAILIGLLLHRSGFGPKFFKTISIPMIVGLFLLARLYFTRIILSDHSIEFTQLFHSKKIIPLHELREIGIDQESKSETLLFYDNNEYRKEPLQFSTYTCSKKDVQTFKSLLKQANPSLTFKVEESDQA